MKPCCMTDWRPAKSPTIQRSKSELDVRILEGPQSWTGRSSALLIVKWQSLPLCYRLCRFAFTNALLDFLKFRSKTGCNTKLLFSISVISECYRSDIKLYHPNLQNIEVNAMIILAVRQVKKVLIKDYVTIKKVSTMKKKRFQSRLWKSQDFKTPGSRYHSENYCTSYFSCPVMLVVFRKKACPLQQTRICIMTFNNWFETDRH